MDINEHQYLDISKLQPIIGYELTLIYEIGKTN